jgi:hypothetical protein
LSLKSHEALLVFNPINMKILFCSLIFTLFSCLLHSQVHLDKNRDHSWMMGSTLFFTLNFDVEKDTLIIESIDDIDFKYHQSNAAMCDTAGNLLFYANSAIVNDISHQRMEGGEALVPGVQGTVGGSNFPQTVMALPFPDNPGQFFIINQDGLFGWPKGWSGAGTHLYAAHVDMEQNNGLGAVVEAQQTIIEDTLALGFITASRHANGRDWWIISPEHHNNQYHRSLLDPSGVHWVGKQVVGDSVPEALGMSVFSPDGSMYVRFSTLSYDDGAYIHLYDFDRCTGLLSNPRVIFIPIGDFGGIAISPNSRYLYLSMAWTVTQYDLWADNIAASLDTVAVYDGYVSLQPTFLGEPQLGPDNRIYMAALGSNDVMHYIDKPNLAGEACDVRQHAIQLPTTNFATPPNFPYFRLGALPGSPCDSLGMPTPVEKPAAPASLNIQVFPNPAQDVIHLSFPEGSLHEEVDLVMHDAVGRKVKRFRLNRGQINVQLDVSDMPAGMYTLAMHTLERGFWGTTLIIGD